ncbi:unnamed protein product [Durusdinium trenchii]|uniref:Uncharacterized protein n=1 Tax=Durusdinium trenchii TaxID=1381693 RepID=A0ABP0Q1F9_9DINO
MPVMGREDGFAAFLALRKAPPSRSRQSALERLEGLRSLGAEDQRSTIWSFPIKTEVTQGEPEVVEVDRLAKDAEEAPLEENPFASFLSLRPPKPAEQQELQLEQHLRQDVLKMKKQLLEVALNLELQAIDPETPEETALRLRRLQKAHRYLLHPERTADALSGSEDEDSNLQSKIVAQSPSHAKLLHRLENDQRRWSMGMMRRQAPPNVFTPTESRPTTVYQDEIAFGQKEKRSGLGSRASRKKEQQSASAPNLAEQRPLPPLCKQKPSFRTWEGDLVIDEKSLAPLTGWYWKTRSWNIHISGKDLRASRRIPEMAAGGVVFGNGLLPLFSGSHLLSTGYFYAFKVDAVDEEHFPLEGLRDLSLAFGVTFLPGGHRLCKKPMYAYEIPGSILIGYGQHMVDSGEWFTHKAWDPKTLDVGDVVGLLVSPHGDLVVYVNGMQVLRAATSLTKGNRHEPHPRRKALGPRRTLFPLIDLHGRVTEVTLLHGASAPNVSLLARNNVHEKELNPLGVKGKKAFPIPGRSLPGLSKVQPELDDSLPHLKDF